MKKQKNMVKCEILMTKKEFHKLEEMILGFTCDLSNELGYSPEITIIEKRTTTKVRKV